MAEKGKAVVEYRSQGGVDIQLSPEIVRNFLVQGKKELVSAQELMFFMNVCRARKLNPFIKDCYLIKYGSEPAAIVTSVDYFRKNARKAPDCRGWKAGIAILKDGEITYREGSLILDNETLIGGWAEAKPEHWNEPKKHTINLKGYIKKTRDGKVTRFWQPEKQPDMISKVAESQLLRQLWGEETTGMYAVEEMPSVEDAKDFGPVQSEVKQRIMDGKKKADTFDPEPELSETTVVDEPPTPKLKKLDPKPDEPNIKPPVTDELTKDQIVATEKTFSMLCKTVNVTDAEAFKYLEALKVEMAMDIIPLMRFIIEDPKKEFVLMRDWVEKHKTAAPEPEPEPQPVINGKKKRVAIKDLAFNSEAWDPKKWGKLQKTGFPTFVWKNIDSLSGESEALQKAVRRKWAKRFKDDFPVPGANKINGNGNNDNGMIQAEVYHDPNGKPALLPEDEDFESPPTEAAPDKDGDPDGYIKWLRANFEEELEGAVDYLGQKGRVISAMSPKEKDALIKNTERLIDMSNV